MATVPFHIGYTNGTVPGVGLRALAQVASAVGGPLWARPGLRPGGLKLTVAGSNPETVSVSPGAGVIYSGSETEGSHEFVVYDIVTRQLAARPGSGTSRYDEVCARLTGTVNPDARDVDIVVIAGNAAASPTPPAIPVGYTQIGRLLVPASGTITQTARGPAVAALGGVLRVESAAERTALYDGGNDVVYRRDIDRLERRSGAGNWVRLRDATLSPWAPIEKAPALAAATTLQYRVMDDGKLRVEVNGAGSFGQGDVAISNSPLPVEQRPYEQAANGCVLQNTYPATLAVTPGGVVRLYNATGGARTSISGYVEFYPASI